VAGLGIVLEAALEHRGRVHVEPHSHTNEQIVWMLKGKMEFRLGSEQRVYGQGDVVVIPGGAEHEAWLREDTEVIDFFVPPRDDFLVGGKPVLAMAVTVLAITTWAAPSNPESDWAAPIPPIYRSQHLNLY
jgi:uncharacterized protein YjlB